MSHETTATVFALSEESEAYEDESEYDYWKDEFGIDDSYSVVDYDEVNIGGGIAGIRYEGSDRSYVYVNELFNQDGTLLEKHEALYLESEYDDSIMRIEKDGSWMIARGPNQFFSHLEGITSIRGRVHQKDLTEPLVWSDGSESGPVIFFDKGIGMYSYTNILTLIPTVKREIWGNPEYTEKSDVVERFNQAAIYSSLNPEI